jgi:hypothetical protein
VQRRLDKATARAVRERDEIRRRLDVLFDRWPALKSVNG